MSFSSGPFFSLASTGGLPQSQQAFLQTWLSAMQTAYGQAFQPGAADLDFIQAQVFASWAEDVAQLCSSGATELFRQFGTKLVQLPYQIGTAAQAIVTVTAQDTVGYTLPQGTQLTLSLGGVLLAFQTASTLTIAPGSSSGNVTVAAVQAGASFNGAGSPAALVSQITWVTGLTVVTAASGGVDQENDSAYVNRLAQTLQLLAPRPITASDYQTMAINFTPAAGTDQEEVGRASAIDGYDPGANTYGNQREVTVCVTAADGSLLNTDTLTAVQAYLAARREVNFIVNVVQPNVQTVYVACTVKGAAGFTAATVQANVQASLVGFLSAPNFPNGSTVYLSDLSTVIRNTAGVANVPAGGVSVGLSANPSNNTSDLLLAGPFPQAISTTSSIPLNAITVI